jgi:hypothetical protein
MAFIPTDIVHSERLVVIADDRGEAFALLQSSVHEEWAYRPGTTTHETRRTYFLADAFETFPWPRQLSHLLPHGERYNAHRGQLMLSRNEGLTTTYNRFHDPSERADDIARLRVLHMEIDQAVATAYGWTDLDFCHGFHESKQGARYTISESARNIVLDRLLALNHQRHEEEVVEEAELAFAAPVKRGRKKRRDVDKLTLDLL